MHVKSKCDEIKLIRLLLSAGASMGSWWQSCLGAEGLNLKTLWWCFCLFVCFFFFRLFELKSKKVIGFRENHCSRGYGQGFFLIWTTQGALFFFSFFFFFLQVECGPLISEVMGLANWYFSQWKRGLVNWKISKFGGLWTKNFRIWGLRAKIWAKIEAVEAKNSNELTLLLGLRTTGEARKGVFRAHGRHLGGGETGGHVPSTFWRVGDTISNVPPRFLNLCVCPPQKSYILINLD